LNAPAAADGEAADGEGADGEVVGSTPDGEGASDGESASDGETVVPPVMLVGKCYNSDCGCPDS